MHRKSNVKQYNQYNINNKSNIKEFDHKQDYLKTENFIFKNKTHPKKQSPNYLQEQENGWEHLSLNTKIIICIMLTGTISLITMYYLNLANKHETKNAFSSNDASLSNNQTKLTNSANQSVDHQTQLAYNILPIKNVTPESETYLQLLNRVKASPFPSFFSSKEALAIKEYRKIVKEEGIAQLMIAHSLMGISQYADKNPIAGMQKFGHVNGKFALFDQGQPMDPSDYIHHCQFDSKAFVETMSAGIDLRSQGIYLSAETLDHLVTLTNTAIDHATATNAGDTTLLLQLLHEAASKTKATLMLTNQFEYSEPARQINNLFQSHAESLAQDLLTKCKQPR